MHMAKVVVKLLNGDYRDEGGMIADLGLMVENCRRYVCVVAVSAPDRNARLHHTMSYIRNAALTYRTSHMSVSRPTRPVFVARRCSRPAARSERAIGSYFPFPRQSRSSLSCRTSSSSSPSCGTTRHHAQLHHTIPCYRRPLLGSTNIQTCILSILAAVLLHFLPPPSRFLPVESDRSVPLWECSCSHGYLHCLPFSCSHPNPLARSLFANCDVNVSRRYYTGNAIYGADTTRDALANARAVHDALEAVSVFFRVFPLLRSPTINHGAPLFPQSGVQRMLYSAYFRFFSK